MVLFIKNGEKHSFNYKWTWKFYIQCLTGLNKQIHELLAEFIWNSVKMDNVFSLSYPGVDIPLSAKNISTCI